MDIEILILSHLMTTDKFLHHVIDHLKPALFEDKVHAKLFGCMKDYFDKYQKMPTRKPSRSL
jgi:hypothetical protein